MGGNLDPVYGIREERGEGVGGGVTAHSNISGCGVSGGISPVAYCIVCNDTIRERGERRLRGRGGERERKER